MSRRFLVALVVIAVAAVLWIARPSARQSPTVPPTAVAPDRSSAGEPAPSVDSNRIQASDSTSARTALRTQPDAGSSLPGNGAPASARLQVHCIDPRTRTPARGVDVELVDNQQAHVVPAKSSPGHVGEQMLVDESGSAWFDVPAGKDLFLHATHRSSGWSSIRSIRRLAPGETREVSVEMLANSDALFCARVVDGETSTPIPLATIELASGEHISPGGDGRIAIPYLAERPTTLKVEATGYAPARVIATAGHDTPARALEIALLHTAELEVHLAGASAAPGDRVVLRSSGPPREQRATTVDPQDSSVEGLEFRAEFGADARAVLDLLPPGVPLTPSLQCGRDVELPRSELIVLRPGEKRRVEWDMTAHCQVSGHVRESDGRPAAGIQLWLLADAQGMRTYLHAFQAPEQTASTVSDEGGRFVFPSVGPGRWLIGPAPQDAPNCSADAVAAWPERVSVGFEDRTREIELALHRGLYISGVVVDPDGKPLQARVAASGPHEIGMESQTSDTGAFCVGPLRAGTCNLRVAPRGEFLGQNFPAVAAGTEGLRVVLSPFGAIEGVLVDAKTGAPCAGVVHAESESGPREFDEATAATIEAGFRFRLVPGTYSLTATTNGGGIGLLRSVRVTQGMTLRGVRLQIEPGATLHVRWNNIRAGVGVEVRRGNELLKSFELEPGALNNSIVPAGSLLIRWTRRDGSPPREQELQLSPGEQRELSLGSE